MVAWWKKGHGFLTTPISRREIMNKKKKGRAMSIPECEGCRDRNVKLNKLQRTLEIEQEKTAKLEAEIERLTANVGGWVQDYD